MQIPGHRQYQFSIFGFDSRTGDLLRKGHRLRITEQARQVLNALLENAGNIVTREELRLLLWPGGEILDWDHSINKVVAQLRSALRDNARETRFIETVPKRGYRFIAPVTVETEKPAEPAMDMPEDRVLVEALPPATPPDEIAEAESCSLEIPVAESDFPPAPARTSLRRILSLASLALAAITLTVFAALHFSRPGRTSVSVGIPPFEASGEGAETVAESFRMDLANAVTELPSVQVRAAHSLNMPLHDDAIIRATARSLHLDVLLFGKLTLSGDHYVLNIEVVQGKDSVHLASFHYNGSRQELGGTRERFQRDLFDQLGLGADRKWHARSSTPNPRAYEAYLKARLDLSGWADAPVQRGLNEFEEAIREDPGFANAYAGLASAYVVLAEHGGAPRESSYRNAQDAAEKALALAPGTAEAHAILGQVALRKDWNFEVAERELRRAVELDPNQALYHLWLSVLLCDQSRFEESLSEIDLAHAIDPLWAPVYRTENFLANAAGQYPRALDAAEKLTSLMPNWALAYDQRAWTYWHVGRYLDAIRDWRQMAELENDSARMRLEDEGMDAFRNGGVPAFARVRLKAIRSGYPYKHAAMDFVPAEWYCISGDYDQALAEIENMVARHDPDVLQLAVNRTLIPLHDESRFRAVLNRGGSHEPGAPLATQFAGSSTMRSDPGSALISSRKPPR